MGIQLRRAGCFWPILKAARQQSSRATRVLSKKGVTHAWNHTDRDFGAGIPRSVTAMVAQPGVGIRADGRNRSSPGDRGRAVTSRTIVRRVGTARFVVKVKT